MSEQVQPCQQCGVPLENGLCLRCAAALLAKVDFRASPVSFDGPEIPGITVHEEMGEGGFGIVYRATQVGVVRRVVALKVLKPGVDTRAILRRFALEQQTLASLEHPYIARFYDAGETEKGYPWLTMEFIEGEAITEALAGCDWKVILEVFLKVCEAVAYAHKRGVLHRDLKPSNVLVTPLGLPKVIDFGVAKALSSEAGVTLYTADESQVGTPVYTAPESGEEVDERADVYSLGMILFELFSGVRGPEAGGEFPKLREVAVQEVPGGMDRVIARATAAKADGRYGSVKEMMNDLERVRDEVPLARRPGGKRGWISFGVGVVLVALALGVVFWPNPDDAQSVEEDGAWSVIHKTVGYPSSLTLSADGSRALAIFRGKGEVILFDPRNGDEVARYFHHPLGIGSGVFDEDGERFVIGWGDGSIRWYASEDGQVLSGYHDVIPTGSGWVPHLRVVTPPGGEETVLTATSDGVMRAWDDEGEGQWTLPLVAPPYRFEIGPERKLALIGSGKGALNLINLVSRSKTILEGHKAHIFDIKFSPDGSRFACASYDHRCSIWSREGKVQKLLKHDGKCDEIHFSPDGTMLGSASWDGTARLWEVESGEQLHLLRHKADVLALAFSPDGKIVATGGRDNQISFWNVETGESIREAIPCGKSVQELRFVSNPDGGLNLIALSWEPALRVMKLDF